MYLIIIFKVILLSYLHFAKSETHLPTNSIFGEYNKNTPRSQNFEFFLNQIASLPVSNLTIL